MVTTGYQFSCYCNVFGRRLRCSIHRLLLSKSRNIYEGIVGICVSTIDFLVRRLWFLPTFKNINEWMKLIKSQNINTTKYNISLIWKIITDFLKIPFFPFLFVLLSTNQFVFNPDALATAIAPWILNAPQEALSPTLGITALESR